MGKYILVVEDDSDIREIIGIVLSAEGYELELCGDSRGFWNSLNQQLPDLVILDVHLPDGNGIDLCGRLKSEQKTSHIPVMMISAHSSLKEITSSCPADDFMPKPFDIDRLSGMVAALAAKLGGDVSAGEL
ncbi:response regulator transcription factor [Pedobacter sp. GSP4]|uniref:response regulator transcription factor n=1 Tax=Pedobacter sp. GSP4 TaxID=3453716 RepID=UPI003EEFE921